MLVSGPSLHVGAGLFPIEGTWLIARNLADGSERWSVPHRRSDLSLRRALASANGTLAVVSGKETFSGSGAAGAFTGISLAPCEAKIISYPGRHLTVSPGPSCLAIEREVLALDRDALQANAGDVARGVRWKTPLAGATAMAIGGDHVFVGHAYAVSVLGAADRRHVTVLKVHGVVAALAVDATGLVGSTQDGRVIAWNRAGTPRTSAGCERPTAQTPSGTCTTASRSNCRCSCPARSPLKEPCSALRMESHGFRRGVRPTGCCGDRPMPAAA